MTAEIIGLHANAKDAARVALQAAIDAGIKEVIVLGINEDGTVYSDATEADVYRITWLLECYKWTLMKIHHDEQRQDVRD